MEETPPSTPGEADTSPAPTRAKSAEGRTTKRNATPKKKPAKKNARLPAPRGTRGNNRKYDYSNAKAQYIEGVPEDPAKPEGSRTWLNLKEVADRVDIPYQRIRERSSKERWTDLRTNYQASLAKKRHEDRAKKIITEAIEFDDKSLDVAKMGTRLVAARMSEIASAVREAATKKQIIQDKLDNDLPIEKHEWQWLKTQINSAELERLAKSMAMFQDIGMKSLGTDVARHEISGPGGAPIGVDVEHTISVARELQRDDPDRLGAFFAAAHRAGVFEQLAELEGGDEADDYEPTEDEIAAQQEDEDIVDAELVD